MAIMANPAIMVNIPFSSAFEKAVRISPPFCRIPKMLKTFTNLPVLTFIPGSIRNRCSLP